jgi:hypothetical protein
MAMEDAFSLAACLRIAGMDDVSLATKVHNKLRYMFLLEYDESGWLTVDQQIRASLLRAEDGLQEPRNLPDH